ncbi:DeoR/GlpR family DNA-binding transcription regulator [Nocardiopsis ansamitocini]|uniref:DeoR family transcriptional regulator n=1 Tax=Nocardiopsis ansamitocini TaxID=1670832 RepID=A0A9W6P4Y3_9ACTN|nr:DeoR/GlpR family DNA-binding transcription regulator [Nocardiopsis ansamitocini]GLU47093.1 DeoR family transcriptional regulator [Nocardiopsis ansamitocini]
MNTPVPAGRRREAIYEQATTVGLASVEELSARFGVTPSTIRRDLASLHREGRLARTYGGAIPVGVHPETSLRERLGRAHLEKSAIGRRAALLVEDGEVLMLDGGSTVLALARALRNRSLLTVVSTALKTLETLSNAPGITVECIGGRLRDVSGSMVGPIAEAALERMTFDRVFLGADGVDPHLGICEAGRDQARLKELMIRASGEVVVLADSSKIGAAPFHAWTQLGTGWTLVTDDGVDEAQLKAFREQDVTIHIAPSEAEAEPGSES